MLTLDTNCEYLGLDLSVLDIETLQALKAHYALLSQKVDAELSARGYGPPTYWLVDEHNDWEGETFGYALPKSDRADAAMEKWKRSWEAYWTARKQNTGGLEWEYSPSFDEEYLDAFSAGSDNTYNSRVHYLSEEATEKLLTTIEALQPGETLQVYKGNLSRLAATDPETDQLSDTFIFDLWEMSTSGPMAEPETDDDDDDSEE